VSSIKINTETRGWVYLEAKTSNLEAMASTALVSPMQQSHSEALALSREAPQHIGRYTPSRIPIPVPFLSSPESAELWTTYERVVLSCLRTGDDKSAFMCLEKLIERFGAANERIMALRGLYQEAVAENDAVMEKILKEYNGVLAESPTNTVKSQKADRLQRLGADSCSKANHEATYSAPSDPSKDQRGC